MAVKDFLEYKKGRAPVEVEIPHQVFRGPKGDRGEQGIEGKVGQQGPAGADGVDGAIGPQGLQGPPGQAGPAGKDGRAGASGKDADSALLEALRKRIDALAVRETEPGNKKEYRFTIVRDYNGLIKEVTATEV